MDFDPPPRLSRARRDPEPLAQQDKHVWPRQQRQLLQLLRYRDRPLPDPGRRPGSLAGDHPLLHQERLPVSAKAPGSPTGSTAGLKVAGSAARARPMRSASSQQRRGRRRRPMASSCTCSSSARASGQRPSPGPIRDALGAPARSAGLIARLEQGQLARPSGRGLDWPLRQSVARDRREKGGEFGERAAARLRINLSQREFEVEGSEAFVKAYVGRFEAWLGGFGFGGRARACALGRAPGGARRAGAERAWRRSPSASFCSACRAPPATSTAY